MSEAAVAYEVRGADRRQEDRRAEDRRRNYDERIRATWREPHNAELAAEVAETIERVEGPSRDIEDMCRKLAEAIGAIIGATQPLSIIWTISFSGERKGIRIHLLTSDFKRFFGLGTDEKRDELHKEVERSIVIGDVRFLCFDGD